MSNHLSYTAIFMHSAFYLFLGMSLNTLYDMSAKKHEAEVAFAVHLTAHIKEITLQQLSGQNI